MRFEDFQDGHHGGHHEYQNGMILYVAPMHPIKFQVNPTYSLGDLKIFKMADTGAILGIGTE